MTEPTEADYAATRSLLDGWPFDDNEHAYYADIGTCTLYYAIACKIATARAEGWRAAHHAWQDWLEANIPDWDAMAGIDLTTLPKEPK
jgi:hypothetical protein